MGGRWNTEKVHRESSVEGGGRWVGGGFRVLVENAAWTAHLLTHQIVKAIALVIKYSVNTKRKKKAISGERLVPPHCEHFQFNWKLKQGAPSSCRRTTRLGRWTLGRQRTTLTLKAQTAPPLHLNSYVRRKMAKQGRLKLWFNTKTIKEGIVGLTLAVNSSEMPSQHVTLSPIGSLRYNLHGHNHRAAREAAGAECPNITTNNWVHVVCIRLPSGFENGP